MGAASEDLQCPSCRSPLGPLPPRGPALAWVRCRHCGASVPLAPKGGLPPRYTWEVYPGLYPSQPPLTRPRIRWRSLIVPVLLAIAVVAFSTAGFCAYYGWQGSQPGQYTVSGVAELAGGHAWVSGAITLTDEDGAMPVSVSPGGTFTVTGIPTGGVNLNVTYSGYAPTLVETFVSSVYDAGSQGLVITLQPGGPANQTTIYLTPFHGGSPDLAYLEVFQADVGACAVISAIAGTLAAISAVILRRSDRPALGIVGGASGAAIPFAVLIIPVGTTFPVLLFLGLLSGVMGAFTFAIAWIEVIQTSDAPPVPPRSIG